MGSLVSTRTLRSFSEELFSGLSGLSVYWWRGFIPLQMQDFAFAFVELDMVLSNPLLQLISVILNGNPALQCTIPPVWGSFDEGALCLSIQTYGVTVG